MGKKRKKKAPKPARPRHEYQCTTCGKDCWSADPRMKRCADCTRGGSPGLVRCKRCRQMIKVQVGSGGRPIGHYRVTATGRLRKCPGILITDDSRPIHVVSGGLPGTARRH